MIYPDSFVTLPSGDVLRGYAETIPVKMPNTAIDNSVRAAAFVAQNFGKSHVCYNFLGIPYATAPTGAGRWDDPTMTPGTPSTPWDATTPKRIAMQTTGPSSARNLGRRAPDEAEGAFFEQNKMRVIESEDCALLDVRTPLPMQDAKLPVRVHFHDGGNTENPRLLPRYQGDRLTRFGIVSVEAEYPLSTWGFLTHPAFGDSHQPNLTYQFALCVLQWVQENIAVFGGDPDNVTLDGASAGGAMGSLLMPQGGVLFHHVISHSGNGIGTRISRQAAAVRGQDFYDRIIKAKPAYYDQTRTIAEIEAADGVAAALRLGPSPEQVQAFANAREEWRWTSAGVPYKIELGSENLWPVNDGVIIQNANSALEIAADRWPVSVDYWATWAYNEASVIDNASNVYDAAGYFEVLGITTEEDIAAATDLLHVGANDKLPRVVYGFAYYGYGVYRNCRDFTAKGGSAYYTFVDYDSLGTGSNRMGHGGVQQYFLDKPEWQVAQSLTAATLQLYEVDCLLAEYLAQSFANFCKYGDPNTHYTSPIMEPLYPASEFGKFEPWARFGPSPGWNANIIRNALSDMDKAEVVVRQRHEAEFFEFVDGVIGY